MKVINVVSASVKQIKRYAKYLNVETLEIMRVELNEFQVCVVSYRVSDKEFIVNVEDHEECL